MDLFIDSTAAFSPRRRYRYTLHRQWSDGPVVTWIMLNPSTADEHANDPTVERCQRRSQAWGYGGLIVANLFALRATDPSELYRAEDPVGPDNDAYLRELAAARMPIICGWGNHGTFRGRAAEVLDLIRNAGGDPHCLRLTGIGQPGHPLYVPYSVQAQRMSGGGR